MTTTEIICLAIVTLIILRVPIIGKHVRLLNTMMHETGHALAALLIGGRINKIHLSPNTEGAAFTQSAGFIRRTFIAIMGYPFASFMAVSVAWCVHKEWYTELLIGMFVVVALNLLFWVRNWYGVIWLLTYVGAFWSLYRWGTEEIFMYGAMFIAIVLCIESLYTSLVIFYLSVKRPKEAGDATSLRNSTYVPAVIWGVLFAAQGMYFSFQAIRFLLA